MFQKDYSELVTAVHNTQIWLSAIGEFENNMNANIMVQY